MERFRLLMVSVFTIAALAGVVVAADAAPAVTLRLSGALVQRQADGSVRDVPLSGIERVEPGQTLRYTIVALNRGDQPARSLTPVGHVPAGSAYVAASGAPAPAQLQFSLDGTTFSERPMVTVRTAQGPQRRAADPSGYVALRWAGVKLLAPGAAATFSYTVRVR